MILTPFDIIINVIEIAILVWFVSNYLTLKPSTKLTHIVLLYVTLFIQLMISNYLIAYDISLFAISSVTLLIYAHFCTSNHILEKLMISVTVMNMISVLNMFTMVIVSTVFNRTIVEVALSNGPDKTAAIIVSKFMFLSASLVFVNLRKTIHATFLSPNWWHFAVVSGLGMINLAIMISFLYSHSINYTRLVLAIFAMIVMIIVIFYLFIRLQIESQKQYEDQLLIKEHSFQKKSMEDIMAINKELQAYRHDVKHVLDATIGLVKDSQEAQALDMLVKYSKEIDDIPDYIATGNSALDYILNSKISNGINKGIRFKTMYAASPLAMDIDDVCVLVGNALDNAIENCSGSNKEIKIDFRNLNEYVSIKISNTVHGSVLTGNPALKTTKSNQNNHGFGIRSIKYITKKYKGEVTFQEENNEFVCQILLPS